MTDEQVGLCVDEARAVSVDQQIFACTAAIVSGKWSGKSLSWAYVNRAMAYALTGKLDKAFADAEEAISVDPGNAMAFTNRGFVYQFKNNPTYALADFNEAIRLDPQSMSAINNPGNAYLAKRDYTRAIADYEKALAIDGSQPGLYFNRGRANYFRGALPDAVRDFNRSIELDPISAYALLWQKMPNMRSGLTSRLGQAARQIDMTQWPAPVVRL